MPRFPAPPGNTRLRMEDGTPYKAERGFFNVSDEHARAIDRVPGNGTAGLLSATTGTFVSSGRRNGRWCRTCTPARLWQPWTGFCPRCGSATAPESQPAP